MHLDEIKHWLMQQPRPATVRVTSLDGSINDVSCGGTGWPKVAETVAALQPELLQAMAADGKLIRAVRPADRSEDWTDGQPPPRVPSLVSVPITASDPETQRFALVAQLIAEAYRHSTDVAFSRLAGIVDSLVARSSDVERTREQLYRAHVRQLEDQIKGLGHEPESSGDLLGGMIAQFIGGMGAQAASAPPPTPPANGKH